MRAIPIGFATLAWSGCAAYGGGPAVLKADSFAHYAESFNKNDRELYVQHIPNAAAWDWMRQNVPLFECPDEDIEEIYYFRWWTFRKHLKQTLVGRVAPRAPPGRQAMPVSLSWCAPDARGATRPTR